MAHIACIIAIVILAMLSLQAAAQSCPTLSPVTGQPQLAPGYQVSVAMNGLKRPRSIIFDSKGNLLIVEQSGIGVRWVQLQDNGGLDICAAQQKQLITGGAVSAPFSSSGRLEIYA
jgi:glucose/arabinose dehydrogenase